jgi:hypothetical protein
MPGTLRGLKDGSAAHHTAMSMQEPGLDRHEWESELESLEPELRDSPAEALPGLADLVERMLEERGFDINDPVARENGEPEIVREYLAAREVADRVDGGGNVDPGDVASAINGLRALYDHLIAERSAP